MAGLIATILSTLINGPIIAQTLLQGATGAATGVQPPAPPHPRYPQGPFVGDKTTFVDGRGVTRTAVLQADGHWLTDRREPGTDPDYDKFLADQRVKDAEIAAWKAKAEAESAAAQAAIDAAKKLKALSQGIDPVTGKKILTPNRRNGSISSASRKMQLLMKRLHGRITGTIWTAWSISGMDKMGV